eukprot:3001535-Rhodomonas_salina.1
MKYLEHYEIALYYFNKTQPIKVHKVYDECPYLTPTPNYFRNLPVCSEFDGTWFGSPLVDKHGIMEFSISSHREVYFRVEIEMFHGQYLENKNYTAFFGTMSIDFSYPSRAEYFERFEDVSVYSAASLETRPDPREVRLDTDCVVERDGVTRPCSKTFLATIDASNQDLNVALNVEVPYLPTSGNAQYWNFQTMPWIDFASTDPSIPLLSQPFVSSVGTSTKGVGKTMDQAYPPLWTEDPDPFGPFGYVGTGDNEMVVLPYLPFFSSCRGFDSHIFLYRLFEEQSIPNVEGGCNLTESWKTQHIREFDPFNNPSKADLLSTAVDVCRWQFECTFEEQLDKAPLPKRWYSQDPGETLFSITRDAFNENEFREIGRFKSFENTDRLVEAVIRTPDLLYDDELLAQGVPRQVILLVQFYQKSPTMKRIINVEVGLELYEIVEDPEAPGASDYSLEVFFQAMTWTELLNEFAFDVRVYAVFFIIVGLLVILFSAVFWAFHRLFTRLSQPPAFRFRSYAYLTAIPPVQGFILACLPWLAVILLLDILYNQVDILDWQKTTFASFDNPIAIFRANEKDIQTVVKDGRFAVGLFVVSFYGLFISAAMFTPHKDVVVIEEHGTSTESSRKSRIWNPMFWHRTHIVFAYCITGVLCTVMFEFSFSNMFEEYFFESIILLELFRLFYTAFLLNMLGERQMTNPHEVVIDVVRMTATMGASDFTDFIQSFVIETLIEISQRVYLDPGIDASMERWEYFMRVYEKYKLRQESIKDEEGADDLEDDEDLWEIEEEEARSPVEAIITSYS